jgi:hypothetical protein
MLGTALYLRNYFGMYFYSHRTAVFLFFHVLLWLREARWKYEKAQERSVAVVMAMDGEICYLKVLLK